MTIIRQLSLWYHRIQNYDEDYHQDFVFKELLVKVVRPLVELIAIGSFSSAYFVHIRFMA